MCSQKPHKFLVPFCVAPPADVRVIQITYEVKSLQICGFFQMSEETLSAASPRTGRVRT